MVQNKVTGGELLRGRATLAGGAGRAVRGSQGGESWMERGQPVNGWGVVSAGRVTARVCSLT
jgi:hypothetical protein